MTDTSTRTAASSSSPVRLRYQLFGFFLTRMVINTSFRMIYPFLGPISRGVGLPVEDVTRAITLRAALGLFSPLIGSIADTRGRRAAMSLGIASFVAGMLLVGFWPSFATLVAALLLTMFSKIILDPALLAYLGDRVSYEQRGLAVAIAEFSWAGAFFLGVPVAGWLIASGGWNTPFWVLGLIGIGIFLLIRRIVPAEQTRVIRRASLRAGLEKIARHRPSIGILIIGLMISGSNEVVNIVYGVWLENAFAVKLGALGAAAAVIGLAELLGEGLVAGFADRIGKRRALGFGLGTYIIAALLLPGLATNETSALFGLFLFYLTFEFSVVASLPLLTELLPDARATLLAGNGAGHSLGRMLGSLVGPLIFTSGLAVNTTTAAVMNGVALLTLIVLVREHHDAAHRSTDS
ncbi:MAG: MFS transporter [Anaerolineae bacterium]|nr:MFS transporter [Anaerolineae bacterium]